MDKANFLKGGYFINESKFPKVIEKEDPSFALEKNQWLEPKSLV